VVDVAGGRVMESRDMAIVDRNVLSGVGGRGSVLNPQSSSYGNIVLSKPGIFAKEKMSPAEGLCFDDDKRGQAVGPWCRPPTYLAAPTPGRGTMDGRYIALIRCGRKPCTTAAAMATGFEGAGLCDTRWETACWWVALGGRTSNKWSLV
jgi:hypothetical protein